MTTSFVQQAPRRWAAWLATAFALGLLLLSFVTQQYHPWVAGVILTAFEAAVLLGRWWPARRGLTLLIGTQVLLVLLYLWSLDERVYVVVHAGKTGYVATVGGDTLALPRSSVRGGAGLYAGSWLEYHVGPTGESFDFSSFDPLTEQGNYVPVSDSIPARIGQWIRLGVPQSAWTDVRIEQPASNRGLTSRPVSAADFPAGSGWTTTPRGELAGDPGNAIILRPVLSGPYTITADLYRPDGAQGILVGVGADGKGYLLVVRMDQPDLLWYRWDRGVETSVVGSAPLHVQPLGMVQRDLRLLLGNVMAAMLLLLLAVPVYLLCRYFVRRPENDQEMNWLIRRLDHPWGWLPVAAFVSVAGILAAGLVATFLLERIPHVQDSVAYLFQAKTLAEGRISVPLPAHPNFFTEEFVLMHDGRWFGKYPPGWPLLLAVGVLLHGAWLVNPFLTGANILLVFLIGRELYGAITGLAAALLALSSPLLLFLGGSFMAHTVTIFYLTAGTYGLVRWTRRLEHGLPAHDRRHLLPAGFLLGMGLLTRQLDAVALMLPLAGLLLWPQVRRRRWAAGWLAAGALAPVCTLFLYNWILTGSPLLNPYNVWWSFDKPGFDWMGGPSGFGVAQGLWNTSLNVEALLAHLFGWPFYLTLALATVPFLLGNATRWDALFAVMGMSVIVAYAFYWAPGLMYGPRYFACAAPWFVLLTARGFQELYRWPLRLPLRGKADGLAALTGPALLGVLLVAYNLAVYLPAQLPVYRHYNFISGNPLQVVQRANLHHAVIFVVSHPANQWWSYGEVFSANDPLLSGDVIYARDQGARDAILMRQFPGRRAYRLDYSSLTSLAVR